MTDYYFDNQAPIGGTGTQASPFNSSSSLTVLVAGDRALLVGSGSSIAPRIYTWTIALTSAAHNDGTLANPITITTVSGQFVEFQPPSGSTDNFDLSGVDYWVLSGRDATSRSIRINRLDLNGLGVDIRNNCSNIRVEFLEIRNGAGDAHLRILGSSYNTIHNCKIYDNNRGAGLDAHGVLIKPDNADIFGNVIEYCEIYDNRGDNIQFVTPTTSGLCVEHIVRYNNLYFTPSVAPNCENCLDVKVGKYTQVYGNTMHGARYNDGTGGGTSTGLGTLIIFHQQSDLENWIYENEFYDFSGAAVNATASDVKTYRNIVHSMIYEAGGLAADDYRRSAFVAAGPDTIEFIGNTVYGRHGSNGNILGGRLNADIIFRNNICHSTGTTNISGISSNTYDHNCWYNAAATLAGTGDVTSDPLFVNAAGLDFKLQSTSPCRNAGAVYAPYTNGYLETGPDMGRWEFDPNTGGGGGGSGALGNVVVRHTTVACRTTVGTQDITHPDFVNGNVTPKAIELYITRGSADGILADHAALSWGVATGTSNQGCVGFQVQDGQDTTLTHQRHENSQCIFILQAGSTTREGAAAFDSFITGGVRINWTTAPPVGYLLTVVFYAGADVQAYAAQKGLGNTLNLQTDFTEGGFAPDLVRTATAHSHNDTSGTNARVSYGAVHYGGGITQRCAVYRNNSGATNVEAFGHVSTSYGIMGLTSAGAVQWGGEFVTVTNGFGVITRIAGASDSPLLYLALKFTNASSYVGTLTTPTANGEQTVTGIGFSSQHVSYALGLAEAVNTGYSDARGEMLTLGMWAEDSQYSLGVVDLDGAAASDSAAFSNNQAIDVRGGDKNTKLAATLNGFNSDGWSLQWSTTQGTARVGWVVAIEAQNLGAPTLSSAVPGDSEVTLAWTAVTGANGYKVKVGTSTGVYTTTLDVGLVTNYVVTGLTNGVIYYFVVLAYAGAAESADSNELNATPVGIIIYIPAETYGPDYRLVMYDEAGNKVADVVNYVWLSYTKILKKAGLLRFRLPDGHPMATALANNYQIEVWRRNPRFEIDWYMDFRALYKDFMRETERIDRFEAVCVGELDILGWRGIAYKSGVTNRSLFTNVRAETLLKTLVNYNIGAAATVANGRIADGTSPNFTVTIETDQARGNLLDASVMGDNLLETLYKISLVGGGDYDLIKTGPTTWEFRWYTGQRGVDRTAEVVFSTTYGNMIKPQHGISIMDERTVAIVAGQGQADNRTFVSRTGAHYSAAHKVEMVVDARHTNVPTVLNTEGDSALEKAERQERHAFTVAQTPATAYGKHYCVDGELGDLVKARYYGQEQTQKIESVSVSVESRKGETIKVEAVNV